jgi:hypothetical protein
MHSSRCVSSPHTVYIAYVYHITVNSYIKFSSSSLTLSSFLRSLIGLWPAASLLNPEILLATMLSIISGGRSYSDPRIAIAYIAKFISVYMSDGLNNEDYHPRSFVRTAMLRPVSLPNLERMG